MKTSKYLKVLLFISGTIAVCIGAAILFMPAVFYTASGMSLHGDVSLINEIRASGGALLAFGILITLGTFIAKLIYTSLILSALLYLSYGASRLMSMAIDGMPVDALVQAVILEIVVGLLCAFAFMKYHVKESIN